jgi:hypothetical protein
MKKKLLLLAILTIPALLYLNVSQALRYRVVETEIQLLTSKQQEWIEKNKKIIIGIEALGAPSRIYGLASEIEGLQQSSSPESIRVEIDSDNGGDRG